MQSGHRGSDYLGDEPIEQRQGLGFVTQHVAGLGNPRHVVSVNTDPSAPMTATADLGVITDARALLVELAIRAGLEVPAELAATEVSGA